jgi:DNA-binding transcriptional regulator GbsR (MarR family)
MRRRLRKTSYNPSCTQHYVLVLSAALRGARLIKIAAFLTFTIMMPTGDISAEIVPKSDDGGTTGGSLSLNVSTIFKETEAGSSSVDPSQSGVSGAVESGSGKQQADIVALIESEAIQMFIVVARFLGYPRSVGEIFGVLFASEKPMSFQGISIKGGISAGSLSVGLRHLRNLGVVVTAPVAGDRRDYFMVNEDFGRVNASLIRHHVEPRISAAQRKIDRIKVMADKLARSETHADLAVRLQRFADWQSQLLRLITPLLTISQ